MVQGFLKRPRSGELKSGSVGGAGRGGVCGTDGVIEGCEPDPEGVLVHAMMASDDSENNLSDCIMT